MIGIVAGEMYARHKNDFGKVCDLRGTKMSYFSKREGDLTLPKQIPNPGYFYEAKLNTDDQIQRCQELLTKFGHPETELQIIKES